MFKKRVKNLDIFEEHQKSQERLIAFREAKKSQKLHDKVILQEFSKKLTASEFLKEIENDLVFFSDSVRNDVTERMKGNISLLKEKTNYVRRIHDQFESSVQDTTSTANQLKDDLIVTVNSQYESLIAGNKGFSSDLQKTVSDGLAILEPKITIMEDFERIVREYQFPKITSLPVIGHGGAMNTIKHFLSDFKASVTLLIPNPNEIPVDLIAETKRPKRITVASMFDIDDPVQKEMIRKLVEQDNVTVRQLSSQANLPLYLSADRDGEETFFGAHDPENKAEFAGMVSENKGYVDFIGKTITSDFLSRAKKLS
jgi:hypothetical protein